MTSDCLLLARLIQLFLVWDKIFHAARGASLLIHRTVHPETAISVSTEASSLKSQQLAFFEAYVVSNIVNYIKRGGCTCWNKSQLLIWGQTLCQGNIFGNATLLEISWGFLSIRCNAYPLAWLFKVWWDQNSGISNSSKRHLLFDDGTRSCGTTAARRQTHFLWVPLNFKL